MGHDILDYMSQKPKLSESIEDYLESILILGNQLPFVRSVDVATHLGFSKPSVSHAVRLLQQEGYLETTANKQLILTPLGRRIADETYRRHRFFQTMLEDLGVPRDIAEEDACRMEHIISKETFDALVAFYLEAKNSRKDPS